MLEFNVGELASRLRTALGVRGRMPLGLDEVTIPTVRMEDLGRPPFRTQPVEFHGFYETVTAPATAGRNARVACAPSINVPPVLTTVVVVRRYRVQVSSFVTATGVLDPALLGWDFRVYTGPTANLAAVAGAMTTERYASGFLGTNTDALMFDNNGGVSALPANVTVPFDGGHLAPANMAPWVDCNIPLYGDLGIVASTTAASTATSQARLSLSVIGEIYYGLTLPA